jgi:CubicO group peptidase (beta-lactamase class C family)
MPRRNPLLIATCFFCIALTSVGALRAQVADDARRAPLGTPLQVLLPEYRLGSFTHFAQIMPARTIARGGPVTELPRRPRELGATSFEWNGEQSTLDAYLERNRVMALLVIRDGAIVFERYRLGTDDSTAFVSWSMAKSVVGTLVGLAIEDGKIASVDDPTTKYVPELSQSGYGANRLRDLLQMASGVKFIEDYSGAPSLEAKAWIEGNVTRSVRYTDTVAWFDDRIHPPGTRFYYASMEPVVTGWILQRATGESLADYFSRKVWSQMGAEHDASWLVDRPGGLEVGSCCINATLRDYGRFGLLVLNDGRANGKQLIPARWVREMTRPDPSRPFLAPGRLENKPLFGYQHYWWLWPETDRAVMARGAHGQAITIDFDDRVVIVQLALWERSDDPQKWVELAALQRALIRAVKHQR